MKAVFAFVVAMLSESLRSQYQYYGMGPVPGSNFGAQPSMYGPNYPQVQGVNAQTFSANPAFGFGVPPFPTASAANPAMQTRLANTPNTAGPVFPQCSNLDSIGSPVLLIYQAQSIIDNLLDPKNSNSFADFIFYQSTADATNGLFQLYNLVFALNDYSGSYYVGIRVRVSKAGTSDPNFSQSGIGDAEFRKFILNKDLAVVNQTLGLPVVNGGQPNVLKCGDQKFIYSSFGNSPGSAVPGVYPGENQNGALAAMIQQFKEREKSFSPRANEIFNAFFNSTTPSNSPTVPDRWNGWQLYLLKVQQDIGSN